MKPILYPPEERDFDSNGLGVLSDAISCTVTWEGNGIFDLTMEYPMDGIHFDKIADRCIIMAIPTPYKDPQPFRIYDTIKNLDGTATIYANHVAYDLEGVPVRAFSADSVVSAMASIENNSVTPSGFTFWTNKNTSAQFSMDAPASIWKILGGSDGSILDVYGGEYEFDRWAVKLHDHLGQDNGVVIRYGKNMTDLEQERNLATLYTGIYPYWQGSDGKIVTCSPEVVPVDGSFDYTKILTLDASAEFQDEPTPEQLKAYAKQYIKSNDIGKPKVSITVSHEMLEQTDEYSGLSLLERCSVFDTVTVQFEKLGVNVKAKIASADTDVLLERYISLKVGSVQANIADMIAGQQTELEKVPNTSDVQAIADRIAQSVLGAKGGSVRLLDTNGDEMPDTLYIADNPDPAKAVKVWRFNYEGWGASTNGYNGPFEMSAALGVGMYADFIAAGTLLASLIKTGIIRSNNGTTEYNLDNGSIRMGGSSGDRVFIDKSGIQWYGGIGTTGATAQGVIKNGLTTTNSGDTTVYGADTRYQKYGWYHGGNFQGITVEQVDNEVMVSGKLSVNQAVSCRTLKAWDAKERVVRTPLGNLQMNAMESPEPLFWDVGSGVCDSTGVCWIALRPEYAETISRRTALRWVVTPTGGPGSLWVEKLDTGAMVHGGAGQRFDWACAGVQRGFEGCYAEGDPGRYPVPENPGDWLLTAAMDDAAVDLPLTI